MIANAKIDHIECTLKVPLYSIPISRNFHMRLDDKSCVFFNWFAH